MEIIKEIGMPAMLEQCAEECAELSHACLKLSRHIRYENPTPVDLDTAQANLIEEIADVYLCIHEIATHYKGGVGLVLDIREKKLKRWEKRLEEHKKGENIND